MDFDKKTLMRRQPDYTCPIIDKLIADFPGAEERLEQVRKLNTEIRKWGEDAIEDAHSELSDIENDLEDAKKELGEANDSLADALKEINAMEKEIANLESKLDSAELL